MSAFVLLVALLLLWGPGLPRNQAAEGSSSHSLRYFYTSVSEPGQGLPQFIIAGYVDNQLFLQYDSNSRKFQPRVTWMEKADADYWDTQTQIAQEDEPAFRENIETLRNRYNQSEGSHTWQAMYGCELRRDGSKGGHLQYAYDGRDYISLDKETLTWTALDVPAQVTKRKWEAEPLMADSRKAYLEVTCIEWLKKYLVYNKEALLRTEPPVGKVTRQTIGDGQETLICQAHGFYPREIEATWRKGDDILEHETFRRNIAPNSDGTYHIWLSIEIDPKERDLYRCHIDHASLPKPLVLAFKEPRAIKSLFIIGTSLAVVLLVITVSVIILAQKAGRPLASSTKVVQKASRTLASSTKAAQKAGRTLATSTKAAQKAGRILATSTKAIKVVLIITTTLVVLLMVINVSVFIFAQKADTTLATYTKASNVLLIITTTGTLTVVLLLITVSTIIFSQKAGRHLASSTKVAQKAGRPLASSTKKLLTQRSQKENAKSLM